MRPISAFALLSLLACGTDAPLGDQVAEADVTHLIREIPDAPPGGVRFLTPAYEIPPYTEKQLCLFGTLDWPEDRAIHFQGNYQSENGHHIVLLRTSVDPRDYPDGEVFDCTEDGELDMTDMEPLFILPQGVDPETGAVEYTLPEGMAAELPGGSRYVLQSHYVNTTDKPIRVQDAVTFGFIPPETVTAWTAAFTHVYTSHPIQPGEEKTLSFECAFDNRGQDLNILFMGGHMHEWGTAFHTDLLRAGSSEPDRIYDIPVWDTLYRDLPPINDYTDDPLVIHEGDRFSTNCTWVNTEDYVLDFPHEMCVTFGMVYPSKVPMICDPS
jgi:hypothetical protein